jgi:dienelactone hydrolase
MRRLWAALGLTLAAAVLCCPAATAEAAAAAGPCADQPQPAWQGVSASQAVTVDGLAGTVLAPGAPLYRGRRAAVVLMHGVGGNQCGLWWAARHLAGHGFIALVLTHDGPLAAHVAATRAAVSFLQSRRNPYARRTDPGRVGVAGHSQGSNAAMVAQEDDPRIDAIVALDSLKAFAHGDRSAFVGCVGPRGRITPRVPALGLARDARCPQRPQDADPAQKLDGHQVWRAARIPTATLVLRGFAHASFARRGTDAQHRLTGRFLLAWFDRWLGARRPALRPIIHPPAGVLSARFRSAAFIPGHIDTDHLAAGAP